MEELRTTKAMVLKEITDFVRSQIEKLREELSRDTVETRGDIGDLANGQVSLQEKETLSKLLSIYDRDLFVLVMTRPECKEAVENGSLVHLTLNGEELKLFFLPLTNSYTVGDIKTASTESPIFQRIKGAKKGSKITYELNGSKMVVEILDLC